LEAFAELLDGSLQSSSGSHNARVPPHQILDFADNFFPRHIDWSVRHGPAEFGGGCPLRAQFIDHSFARPCAEN